LKSELANAKDSSDLDYEAKEKNKLPPAPPSTRSNTPIYPQETLSGFKSNAPSSLWFSQQNTSVRDRLFGTNALWSSHIRDASPRISLNRRDYDRSGQSDVSYGATSSFDGPLEEELALEKIGVSEETLSPEDEDLMRRGSLEKQWSVLSDLKSEDVGPLPTWIEVRCNIPEQAFHPIPGLRWRSMLLPALTQITSHSLRICSNPFHNGIYNQKG